MKRISSKLTFRISISISLALIAIAALFGSGLQGARSSAQSGKRFSVQVKGKQNPYVILQSGRELEPVYTEPSADKYSIQSAGAGGPVSPDGAQPLSLASSDINVDGYPDLVCGYASASGGMLTLYRGNSQAFAPSDPNVLQGIVNSQFPEPFLREATVFQLPVAPDFISAGDFNRDSIIDMIVAARGGDGLYLLAGDGQGGFITPQRIELPGAVTAMIAADISQQDGTIDVIVSVNTMNGASVLVFEGKESLLETTAVEHFIPAEVKSLAVGRLDDDRLTDIAIVAGGQVSILHGRDSSGAAYPFDDPRAGLIEPVSVGFAVNAIALGEFIWDRDSRMEIAMLDDNGTVHIIARGELDTRPFTTEEMSDKRHQLEGIRERMERAASRGEVWTPPAVQSQALSWSVVEDVAAPEGSLVTQSAGANDAGSQPILLTTRISSLPSDDLLVMNPGRRQIQVMYKQGGNGEEADVSTQAAKRESVELESDAEIAAVLPMRVNVMGQPGLVMMSKVGGSPLVFMPQSHVTIVVNTASDTVDANTANATCADAGGNCSLRAAIQTANSHPGTDLITFAAGINPTLTISSAGGHEDAAATGDLDINSSVTITGNAPTTISTNYNASCGDCKIFGVNQPGTNNGLSVSISGVTLQNGFNDGTNFSGTFFETGGAIDFFMTGTGNSHSMTNSTVTNNRTQNGARSHGGGINVDSRNAATPAGASAGTISFTNITITNNMAQNDGGGGIFLAADKHDVTMTNCVVTGNSCTSGSGGGIWVGHSFGGTVTINGASGSASSNSGTQGGGIFVGRNTVTNISQIAVNTNTATGNVGQTLGGGVAISTLGASGVTGSTSLSNMTINNNDGDNNANAGGGGVYFDGFYGLTITSCNITNNISDTGGGILNGGSSATPAATVAISGGSITGNTATVRGGGFAAIGTGTPNPSSVTTFNNVMIGGTGAGQANSAPEGGGIANINTASTTITGNSIAGNSATGGAGGGILNTNTASITLNGVTIDANSSTTGGDGLHMTGGTFTGQNTINFNSGDSLQIAGGTFNSTAGTMNLNGNFIHTAGTFNANGGTVVFNSAVAQSLNGIATETFNNLTINKGGGALTVGGSTTTLNTNNLTITAGTFVAGTAATINVSGNWANTGTFTPGTGTVVFNGNGNTQTLSGTTTFNNLTINHIGAGNVTASGSTLTVTSLLRVQAGTFISSSTFNNVQIDAGATLQSDGSTINVSGNWTNNGTFTASTGTVIFNGAAAQTISGSSTTTFNNMTDANTASALIVNSNINANGTLTVNANAILSPAALTIIGGTGTLTGNGTVIASRVAATPDFLSQYTITNKTLTDLTVDYGGAGNQTVNNTPAYGHVRISGTGIKTLQGATTVTKDLTIAAANLDVSASNHALNVGGNWSNSATFTPRAGTVTFNGSSGTQTLTGTTTFFNLTLNNSGATTNFGSSSITIQSNLVTSAGTMDGGTSTITFTGNPGSISGANAKNFNNLVINAGANVSNTTGGNTTIENDFTNNGTFTQAATLTTTFATGADGLHSLSGNGSTTFGIVDINGSNTVDAGSHNFNVVGATFTVNGTFNGNTGTVTFNGAVAQSILGAGSKNFAGLTINNINGVTVNNVASAVDALVSGALTLTTDLTIAPGAILQQSGTSAGTGDAIGTVRRTDLGAIARAFGNPFNTISIDSGTAPTQMDFTLVKMAPVDFPLSVLRTYTLTPTGGAGISATVKLHYLDVELNGNVETKLALWRKNGTWAAQGRTGAVDIVNNAVMLSGVSQFSDWTLAAVDPPTISKAFGASSIPLNGTTTLTFTVTNPNASTALTGISFTDNLPAGLVVADTPGVVNNCGSGTVTANAGAGVISYSGGTIAANSSCTIVVNVKGTTPGDKNNTTDAITSTEAGTGATSNTATVTVVAPPTIAKAFGASSIPLNGTTTLTFTLTNPAGNTVSQTGVAFTDNLPAGLVVADTPGVVNNCGSGTVTANAGDSTISYSGGTLTVGQTCTIVVNVKGTTAGDKSNTTSAISSTEGGTGATSNTAIVTVVAPPTISKAFGAANIPLNGTTTLTFTLTNPAGNTVSQTGVAFTDNLPAGLVVADTPGVVNNCGSGTVTAVAGAGVISYSGGTLTAGQTCTIVVNVKGTTEGAKNNTTDPISSNEGGTGATSNTATVTVASPPTISKAFGASSIPIGGVTTLTFTITNPNAAISLSGISFSDNLPAGLQVANPPGIAATCMGTWNATAGDTTLNFGGGTLGAGQSCTLTVNITGTTSGVKNNTTNAITSTEGGTGATSNTATITVVGPPTISKAFGAASIPLNGTTTLTFTLNNPNSVSQTGVAFTDNLPAGLVVADTPGVVNNCGSGTVTANAGASTISYSGGTLTASQTCTIVVNVKGTTAGDKNNTTSAISSTEGGTGATSNTATVTVVAPPTIAKIFGASNIPLNGTTTLTFTITNPAANTISQTGVAFTDNLPAGLVVADTPGVVNNCGSGTVTANAGAGTISYSGGTIGVNSSCTIVVNVKGTTPGVKNNTTNAISSTEGGTGATSNTATIAVADPPTISKAFNVANIPVGGTATITFTLTNNNSSLALTGVAFTDNLPAGLVVAATPNVVNNCGSGTVTAAPGSGTISYSGGSLATSQTCTITVDVTGTTAGVKNNTTGPISSTETGAAGPSNTATIEVVAPPTISKAFGASTIPLNGTTTITFTIANPNVLTTLNGISFTDNLPAGLVVADTPGVVNNCGSGTVTANAGAGTISYSGGVVAAGQNCTIVVNVKGTTAGAKNNTTNAISANESGTGATSNTATVTVIAPPTIAKMFGATSIALNGTTTLTFTITNPNAADALSGIAFTDNLPAGLVVADTPGVVNNCGSGTVTAVAGAGVISYSGGTLAANSSCTIVVNVKGTTEGLKNNTTNAITSTNGGTGATSNTATLAVAGPPTISKAFGASSIPLNGTTTLTFTLTNNNTTVGITGVAFTDNLPAGLVVADTPGVVNNCGSGTVTANAGAGTISYSGGTLTAGQTCTIVVNVKGTTAGDKNNTTEPITSTETGPGAASNTATLAVVGPPTISKAFGASSIPLNGTTTLTFTLTNPAGNTVSQTGVAFTDNLPAGLVVADTPGVVNNCGSGTVTANAGAGTISYSGGTLTAGQTCTIVVNVKGTTAGDKNNTSNAISSTTGGTGATSNTATVTVVAPPVIAKAFGAAGVPLNGTTTLTFTLTNPTGNTVSLTGVAFTDNLPAGLVVADTPGVVNNCGSGTVTAVAGAGVISYSGGTLAANSSCTIVVNVKGTTQGPKNNTTGNVTSTNGGTGNTASATLQVNSPPVAKCKNVTVVAGADCKANASINDGSFDPDMGDTITLTQTPPGPYMLGNTLVTLTVTDNNGAMSQCQATVTVVDQTPPTITCPANITTKTVAPNQSGVVVNYPTPSVENGMVADNCAIQSVVCSPASGSVFPVGATTVTCTATDTSGNTASCTFKVTTFDVCIESDTDPTQVILINSFTGDYVFCCGNLKLTGKGKVNKKGATIVLTDNKNDRRVSAQVSSNTVGGFRGAVTLQSPVGQTKCNFVDDDNRNNACNCSAP